MKIKETFNSNSNDIYSFIAVRRVYQDKMKLKGPHGLGRELPMKMNLCSFTWPELYWRKNPFLPPSHFNISYGEKSLILVFRLDILIHYTVFNASISKEFKPSLRH